VIITSEGRNHEIGQADSVEQHDFVRQILAAVESGEVPSRTAVQRIANMALLVRPLALRVQQLLDTSREQLV
jgi:hypothetical protein